MRSSIRLALPLLVLCAGCASTGGDGAATPSGDAPSAGSLKARERQRIDAQRDAESRARAAAARDVEERGFDFGRGPVARKPRATAEEAGADVALPADRGVRITWEALAVERDQVENPRFGRRPLRGAAPDLKIVLVSDTHPAAGGREGGRAATRDKDGSQVAILPEKDLRLLVRGLREAGFYGVSRPTGSLEPQFSDEAARGRVTIEVDGESQTVLSMRGQGASSATRDVPRVYSESKQAVATMRNQSPTLNVLTAGGNRLPTVAPRRRGERRVLTAEEAAEILGEAPAAAAPTAPGAPPRPAPAPADDWLGGGR